MEHKSKDVVEEFLLGLFTGLNNRMEIKGDKMIKKLILTFLILAFTYNAYGNVRNIQDNHQVIYHIIDGDGNHVGSETVALSIMKVSNNQWYDFNDSSFKASGWTSKTTNLSEDSVNEFYYYSYNPPVSETAVEEYVFLIDNASAIYGDHQSEMASYQNIGTGTSTLVASDNIGINWADVAAPTTTVGLTNTTISTTQTITSVSGSVGSVAAGVTVSTNNDKTGYALADSTSDAVIADAIWNALVASYGSANTYGALVETNLDTTVSSRGTSTLTTADNIGINWADITNPTSVQNLSATNIDTDQVVASVTTKTGYSLSASGIDGIWDEVITGHATADSFGKVFDDQIDGLRTYGDSNWATATVTDIWNKDISGYTGVGYAGTYVKNLYDNQDWDVWDDVTRTLTAGTKDTEIDDIKTKTDQLVFTTANKVDTRVDYVGANAVTTPGDFKADVSDLDVAVSTRSSHAAADIWAVGTREITGGTITTVSDKTGYSLSAVAIDAIWDELQSGHTTAGTFGKYLDTEVSSGDSAATIWAYGTRILTALDEDDTSIDLDGTTVGGLTTWDKIGYTLSEAGIDSIWDELQAGHITTGSFGVNLDATVSTRAQPSDVQIYVGQ